MHINPTTLTERLREALTEKDKVFREWVATQNGNVDQANYEAWSDGYDLVIPLAQELHALLVECGEALKTCGTEDIHFEDQMVYDYDKVENTLAKLKQAGIV